MISIKVMLAYAIGFILIIVPMSRAIIKGERLVETPPKREVKEIHDDGFKAVTFIPEKARQEEKLVGSNAELDDKQSHSVEP